MEGYFLTLVSNYYEPKAASKHDKNKHNLSDRFSFVLVSVIENYLPGHMSQVPEIPLPLPFKTAVCVLSLCLGVSVWCVNMCGVCVSVYVQCVRVNVCGVS